MREEQGNLKKSIDSEKNPSESKISLAQYFSAPTKNQQQAIPSTIRCRLPINLDLVEVVPTTTGNLQYSK